MFTVAIGHSEDIDSADAIEEVLEQCREELGDATAQAGILYASIDHEYGELLEAINRAHPEIELIGCTTDGELSSRMGFLEDSITLLLFHSDVIDIKAGFADHLPDQIDTSIAEAVQATVARLSQAPKLCIMHPVSITASGSAILERFKAALGEDFPIFGASAGDRWEFKQTYQFYKQEVHQNGVGFLVFSGPLHFGAGVSTGWVPKGNLHTVTRVEGNVVYTIDEMTAVEFYQQHLGEHVDTLGDYPLAIFEDGENGPFYLRAALMANVEDGSIVFAGDIDHQASVRIMTATTEQIIAASEASVQQSLQNFTGKQADIAICFSCSGRKQALGTRTGKEYEQLRKSCPDIKVCGFYGYGEISPLQTGTPAKFHNETFVTLLLGTNE